MRFSCLVIQVAIEESAGTGKLTVGDRRHASPLQMSGITSITLNMLCKQRNANEITSMFISVHQAPVLHVITSAVLSI